MFESPRGALRAAVDLQRRCVAELRADPALPLWVGVGIDAGEAVPVADGYRGGALNLAARLCSLAGPGEVLVSDGVVHLARRVDDTSYVDRGRNRVKGLADPVHVFKADFPLDLPEIPRTPAPRWTRTRIAVIAITGLMALVGVVALALTSGGGPAPVAIRADSLAEIDVKARRVMGDVPLGAQPGDVVSGGGSVWVADEAANNVIRVDPATARRVGPPEGVGIDPAALAFGDGALWVYDPVDGLLAKVDPNLEQRAIPSRFRVSPCPKQPAGTTNYLRYGCKFGGIAVGNRHVWIGREVGSQAGSSGGIWRVDGGKPRPTRTPTIPDVPAGQLAYGAGSIWTSSWPGTGGGEAAQINASRGKLIHQWVVPNSSEGSSQNLGLTYDYGDAWLVSPSGDLVEYASGHLAAGESGFQYSVQLPRGSVDVAAGGGYLWVTNDDGSLRQINPYTRNVVHVYRLGHPAYGVSYTKNRVWVGVTNQ